VKSKWNNVCTCGISSFLNELFKWARAAGKNIASSSTLSPTDKTFFLPSLALREFNKLTSFFRNSAAFWKPSLNHLKQVYLQISSMETRWIKCVNFSEACYLAECSKLESQNFIDIHMNEVRARCLHFSHKIDNLRHFAFNARCVSRILSSHTHRLMAIFSLTAHILRNNLTHINSQSRSWWLAISLQIDFGAARIASFFEVTILYKCGNCAPSIIWPSAKCVCKLQTNTSQIKHFIEFYNNFISL
jgi:hypothetical protein